MDVNIWNRGAARALPGGSAARGFTLIELVVVITVIVILMALLFPAFKGVQDQAKRTQAKNDLTQVVTAVNAFYTEYGQYPYPASVANTGADAQDFFAGDDDNNNKLFDVLRADPNNGTAVTYNPKLIAFFQPTIAKDLNKPRSGIGGNGRLYDPWNNTYRIRIDNNYNNAVQNPYSSNAGFDPIQQGVIAWSIGKDQDGAKTATSGADKNTGTYDDDVISWQ